LNIDNGGVMTLINTLKPQTSTGTTGQFAFDSSGGSNITIANNATATPFGSTTPQGIFTVTNTNSGKTAFFFLGGDGTPVILSQGTSTEYTVTSGSAGKTNVFTSGSVVTIENKIGSSQNYKVTAWRVA
ncbi:MAG: hypothetical protein KGI08_11100, partial [Thaumarchaeota archaeon]|nr:hypothetical protein [Nitrososphaerota archaeon]